jgi:hypothetical protein
MAITIISAVAQTSAKKALPIQVRKLVMNSFESFRLLRSCTAPTTVVVTR